MLKKSFRAAALAAVLFGSLLSTQSAHAFYGESSVLTIGSQNADVTALQADLRLLGYFTYPTNTGYFGEVTADAVKAFQKAHGLEANGKVGLTTGPMIKAEADAKRPAASAVGSQLIESAKTYLGTPYRWAGRDANGFDCSGFVGFIYEQQNISLSRTAADIYNQGSATSDPQPGDLVFFNTYDSGATHVGIYLGQNQFISATTSHGVKIDTFDGYWGPRYLGARTVL